MSPDYVRLPSSTGANAERGRVAGLIAIRIQQGTFTSAQLASRLPNVHSLLPFVSLSSRHKIIHTSRSNTRHITLTTFVLSDRVVIASWIQDSLSMRYARSGS